MQRRKYYYKAEVILENTAENAQEGLKLAQDELKDFFVSTIKPLKSKRTETQNNALHLWFTQIAQELNNQGVTLPMILAKNADVPVTPELFKSAIFKPLERKLFSKTSTTELDKDKEIDTLIDVITKLLGELWQIHIPFPTKKEN